IRDRNVTGVQTCALPISGTVPTARSAPGQAVFAIPLHRGPSSSEWRRTDLRAWFRWQTPQACSVSIRRKENKQAEPCRSATTSRSEERRVGKESRAEGGT